MNALLQTAKVPPWAGVRAAKWLPSLALVCLSVAYRLAIGWHPFDDAFITFRYARNLSEGLGLVYNAGERVLGTTAPLYAMLLATLQHLSGADFQTLAWVTNLIAEGLNVVLLYALCQRFGLSSLTGVGVGAVYSTAVFTAGVANGGMETPLFVYAILGCGLALYDERWRVAGVVLGLAILLRPEGLIVTLAALTLLSLKQRCAVMTVAGIAILIGLPWFMLATWYYGSPLPQSMTAKMAMQQPPLMATMGLWHAMVQSFWPQVETSSWPFVVITIVSLYFVLLGILALLHMTWKTWYVPITLGALAVFYSASNPQFFEWYAMPFIPLVFIVTALALEKVFPNRLAGVLLLAVAAIQGLWWLTAGTPLFPYQDERIALYKGAAAWLNNQGAENSYLAVSEIGVIGYSIPGSRILDTVGLVSPEAVAFRAGRRAISQVGYDDGATDLVLAKRPDYIVSLDSLGPSVMETKPEFRAAYRKVYERPTQVFESTSLQIWQRVTK